MALVTNTVELDSPDDVALADRMKSGRDKIIAELRKAIVAALGERADEPPAGRKGWPHRYAARRMAWHVLDHAWEMQDRTETH